MTPGTRLDRYRIESLIGAGGMGVVYLATHELLGKRVALKVLRRDLCENHTFIERLKREATVVAGLHHPNIVQVTDLVIEPPNAFMVMEYLEGESLATILARPEPCPPAFVAQIAHQLLSALETAHRAGLVHRDVKPDNILVTRRRDGRPVAKLLDFGLVKVPEGPVLTASRSVLGTWSYMAPEQARGEHADGRADIYALGACLYYALTKERPHQAAGMEPVSFALAPEKPPPIERYRDDVPESLRAAIERALAKDSTERWPSARAMRLAIRGCTDREARTRAVREDLASTVEAQVVLPSDGQIVIRQSVVAPHSSAEAPRPQKRRTLLVVGGTLAFALGIAIGELIAL